MFTEGVTPRSALTRGLKFPTVNDKIFTDCPKPTRSIQTIVPNKYQVQVMCLKK